MELIALNPQELQAAHKDMIDWAERQIGLVRSRLANEERSLEVARREGWRLGPHQSRIRLLKNGITFYEKVRAALREGYVIVPNFRLNVFAIRTTRPEPRYQEDRTSSTWYRPTFTQAPDVLPVGEGEYKDPDPLISKETQVVKDKEGKDQTQYLYWPHGWSDVSFPVVLAKARIMEPAARAMALKVFDDIGVAVDDGAGVQRRVDPIVCGRIHCPFGTRNAMTFFIAWQADTRQWEPREF